MDQVTNFLENIITVELPEDSQIPKDPADERIMASPVQSKSPAAPSAVALKPPPEKDTKPSNISSFWYLEDDHKKVANQMTDKLIERVLNVIIDPSFVGPNTGDSRMEIHHTRPQFSINLMTLNSIKFAQRISPVFKAIDDTTYMMSWKNPYLTVGILLMGTLIILHPRIITALPPFFLLKNFLIPSYLKLHRPDPLMVDGKLTHTNPMPSEGPPLEKFEPPKPVPQLSREFIMNFTDMQNHLVPYIRLYDAAINWGQHYFLFEDANLSCVVFLFLWTVILCNLFLCPTILGLFSRIISLRMLAIIYLWAFFGALHPAVRGILLDNLYTEEARLERLNQTDKVETKLMDLLEPAIDDTDVVEIRDVEIFELHRLNHKHIWEPVGFTNDFFSLNNPLRAKSHCSEDDDMTGPSDEASKVDDEVEEKLVFPELPRKATLAEIKPPQYWAFTEQEWCIDYEPMSWVETNFIMDLVSVDTDEKWVYDYVDGDEFPDRHTYRRRRWVRRCRRETLLERNAREDLMLATASSDRIGKTLSTLLN